jgi:hypothetical protein
MADNGATKCLLCGEVTAPGYLIAGKANQPVGEFHGRHKNMYGLSVRRTSVEARMCTACGFIMAFAENPRVLDPEMGKG